MFFPPNEMLFGTSDFNVSQVALFFSQTSEKVENFSDKSVMTNLSVGASISTPWVAGSAEFSHETKNRTAEKGSNIKSVFKVEVPIGIFTLPRPSELKNSKIKLNDDFKSFVNKYLEDHPDCTREKIQEAMTERFGDVVPQSVKIGVACYTTDITKLEESQSLEAVSNSFAASVKGAYGCFSGGGHAGYGQGSSNKEGNSSQDKTFTFSAIAGSLPDPNNPMSVADYRVLPISWRIIDFGDEFTPVYDYLDEDVKDHLNKIQSSTTSVNTDKTHLYPGQSLDRGDQLITSGFRLIMQHDGDLALYCGPYSNLLWNTDTAKSKACRLICEGSGNLALVDNDGRTHWASNTAGKGIQRFVLKDNGNFVGYKGEEIIWQTETANKFSIDGTSMFKGATLRKGNKLVSSSGKEELRLRMDGNLEWCGQNGGPQLLSFSSKSNTQELHFDGRALCAISRQTKLVATRMVWSIRISLQSLARFTLIDGQALKGYDRDGKLIVVESMHSLSRSYCPSSQ
ncbi:uncharacterized protein [Clytia hemisphaerica]|uniref:Bulb-type lectin domain-containing protein n=1 Tax=Clytia hemisphaerica TaxID=252671 RepID=A0A7M5X8K1_9CNID